MPSYVSNSKIGRRTVPEVVAGIFPLPVDGLSFSMRRTLLAAEIESDQELKVCVGELDIAPQTTHKRHKQLRMVSLRIEDMWPRMNRLGHRAHSCLESEVLPEGVRCME